MHVWACVTLHVDIAIRGGGVGSGGNSSILDVLPLDCVGEVALLNRVLQYPDWSGRRVDDGALKQ